MLPREKLIELGVQALTTSELLAIILGSGTSSENVFELSERISNGIDFRKRLLEQQVEYWTHVPGIGPSKAARLVASMELSKRMLHQKSQATQIRSAKDVFNHLRPMILGKSVECFYVICMDTKGRVLLTKEVHQGMYNFVLTDMKILLSTVLQSGASSFICAHNHPSGQVIPSREDIELTRKIAAAAKSLDLQFLDHVIVSAENFYSLVEKENHLFEPKVKT